MKIALVSGIPEAAVDQVMQVLAKGLRAKGIECDVFNTYQYTENNANDLGFEGYDLVHYGYYNYAFAYRGYVSQPQTANIWHIPPDRVEKYGRHIIETGFDRMVCDDITTLQMLGQVGIMNCTPIELFFDYTKHKPLPPPSTEFTVGVFCNDYGYKRWETVAEACLELDIMCHPVVTNKDRRKYSIDPAKDVYAHCHVMVQATFMDTNSLPIREGLLCGRPAIVTHSDGLNRIIVDGENGYFFDGSKGDLKKKILLAKENYERLALGARRTILPSQETITDQYIDMFEKVLDEIEID